MTFAHRGFRSGFQGWNWKSIDFSGVASRESMRSRLGLDDEMAPPLPYELEMLNERTTDPAVLANFLNSALRIDERRSRWEYVFALDCADGGPSLVWRTAIARAYADTSTYTERYVAKDEDRRGAADLADMFEAQASALLASAEDITAMLTRYGVPVLPAHYGALAIALRPWVEESTMLRKEVAEREPDGLLRPDQMLYHRLATISSFLTGEAAPLRDDGPRRTRYGDNEPDPAPDQRFVRLLRAVLTIAGWPADEIAAPKLDALRGIRRRVDLAAPKLGALSDTNSAERPKTFDPVTDELKRLAKLSRILRTGDDWGVDEWKFAGDDLECDQNLWLLVDDAEDAQDAADGMSVDD
jgi:hypothetical protein